MSKSFIKLLDNALLPASIMLVSKFVGIFLIIRFFNLDWVVQQTPNSFLSFQTVLSSQNVVLVTSYSDLIMFAAIALGFTINILRAVFFHNSHISPQLLNRLASKNLMSLIKNSYEIYHAASVWLFFLWISVAIVLTNALNNAIYSWVGISTVLVSILLTIIFFQDVYREVEYAKQHPGKYLNQ